MEEPDLDEGTQDGHPDLWHEGGHNHETAAQVQEGSARRPHVHHKQLCPPRRAEQVLSPLQGAPWPRPGSASPGKAGRGAGEAARPAHGAPASAAQPRPVPQLVDGAVHSDDIITVSIAD